MAKEITNEDKLKALYELQLINSKIDELRVLQGELPIEVRDMADEVEGLKTRLGKIEEDIKNAESKTSECKVKMQDAKSLIARYTEQQNNVRNNREYDNLTKEIEFQNLEITLAEKTIGDMQNRLAELQEHKAKTMEQMENKQADLNQKRTELQDILAETKEQTEALLTRSLNVEGKVKDDRLLTAFKRIRKNAHNGLAVVTVERDACGGCHNKIPSQRQLDIRLRKKIIVCEYCGRILVDPEMAATIKVK